MSKSSSGNMTGSIIIENIYATEQKQLTPHNALIFSGGGAKGGIYPGVYAALMEETIEPVYIGETLKPLKTGNEKKATKMMDTIDTVVGSSAGALTAAFIATGIRAEKFADLSKKTKLTGLLGKGIITKDGKPLYEFLKKNIKQNLVDYFDEKHFEETKNILKTLEQRSAIIAAENINLALKLVGLKTRLKTFAEDVDDRLQSVEETQKLSNNDPNKLNIHKKEHSITEDAIAATEEKIKSNDKDQQKISVLMANDAKDIKDLHERCQQKDKTITFKDLDILRVCDPEKFKNLAITAVNKTTGKLEYFDADKTPDIEIALAGRASASLPIFFEPVKIGEAKYVDGGYGDNIPIDYINQKNKKVTQNISKPDVENIAIDVTNDPKAVEEARNSGRMLAFAFGNDMDATANIAIYTIKEVIFDPGKIIKFLMNVVFKTLAGIGGNVKYTENENKTHQNLQKNALDTVVLNTGSVGTLSFETAEKKAEYLYIKGYCQTQNFLENQRTEDQKDLRHEIRSFMLDVYDNAMANRENTWASKIKTREEGVKSKELLSFCKLDKWNDTSNKDFGELVPRYVATACMQPHPKESSENSKTVDILLDKLNRKDLFGASKKVKKQFCKAIKSDELISAKNQEERTAILNSKLTKDDIKKFLENNKQLVPNNKKASKAR